MNNKRRILSTVAITALAASVVGCQTGGAFLPQGPTANNQNVSTFNNASQSTRGAQIDRAIARGYTAMPGEFVVRMKSGVGARALSNSRAVRVNSMSPVGGNPASPFVLIKTAVNTSGFNAQAAGATAANLSKDPNVLYAEPNYIIQLDKNELSSAKPSAPQSPVARTFPNDAKFAQQYTHKVISSQKGWDVYKGDKKFILAIVDTGVAADHPDLKAKLLPGYNTVDDNENSDDFNGHGTHCAGIASAITNNGEGVAGVAPNAQILPVAVLSKSGSGSYASVAGGIIWAADHGAKVISMSLGGPSGSKVITDAVQHALSKDALLIAAMGNSGHRGDRPIKSYPAAEPGVMSVGATDSKDKLVGFSQIGTWNSVTAPGLDILSTFPLRSTGMPGTKYGSISGTSMSTPAVSGLAALVRAKYPQLNAAQTKAHIEATSDDLGKPGYDIFFGHGRINVFKALSTAPGSRR